MTRLFDVFAFGPRHDTVYQAWSVKLVGSEYKVCQPITPRSRNMEETIRLAEETGRTRQPR